MVLTSVGNVRQAMKPFRFSDGTIVPTGTRVAVPVAPIQKDESIYENANQFDGFRFSNLRERDGESAKHHVSNTNLEFLHFGHGHHAW
jgi:cytochrome P450